MGSVRVSWAASENKHRLYCSALWYSIQHWWLLLVYINLPSDIDYLLESDYSLCIHARKYHSDHCEFLRAITSIVPASTSKQVNIVIDWEFNFDKSILPVGNHLYCWNYLENDLHWHLKKTSNCTAEQITYFTNTFNN